jgi:hypothetical protein
MGFIARPPNKCGCNNHAKTERRKVLAALAAEKTLRKKPYIQEQSEHLCDLEKASRANNL